MEACAVGMTAATATGLDPVVGECGDRTSHRVKLLFQGTLSGDLIELLAGQGAKPCLGEPGGKEEPQKLIIGALCEPLHCHGERERT